MIKKIAHNPVFICLMVASLLFASCSSDSNEEAPVSAEVKAENLTGKELFKSIIFADGALADRIDFVKDHFDVLTTLSTPAEVSSFHEAENEAMDYLEKKDPLYFENFKKAMITRDPAVILKKLNETSLVLTSLTNEKLAKDGLTVEKIQTNSAFAKVPKVTSKEACAAILFYWAYPGFLVAAAFVAEEASKSLVNVDNNSLAEEFALDIANNI